ncbi:cGMP-dependent 3',5'-cyclic phosphodiesterase-like [Cimex lectularius]|uniref:PDEase domain-containing protein n=1 Tax=Cimex lectularius TaxID=79782 RepID=A0A8I6THU7_CIMLE|nr:cGMP-dependent 3',5'-cyclic phosphodiesterase-like [Cimex lectularius]
MYFYAEDSQGKTVDLDEAKNHANDVILRESVPADLLKLFCTLIQRSSLDLFVHINNYLRRVTSGESSFVLYFSQLVKEGIISVIGENILSPQIRLTHNDPLFGTLLSYSESIIINTRCLPEQLIEEINSDLFSHQHSGALRQVLFIPIYGPGEVAPVFWVGLANSEQNMEAAQRDEALVFESCRYCVALIKNTLRYEEMRQHHIRLKLLISAIWDCSKHIDDMGVLNNILKEKSCEIFECETCSIYLKEDRKLVSRTTEYGSPFDFHNRGLYDIVIPVGLGYTGSVAASGEIVSTTKYQITGQIDFCTALDKYSGQETRNLMAFPMPFKDIPVYGVMEVANKVEKNNFTKVDEMYAMCFGKLAGSLLYHSLHLRKTSANYENKEIINSFLLRHMKVKNRDIHDLFRVLDIPDIESYYSPTCLPSSTNENETVLVIINIFSELDIITHYGIPPIKLLRFILNVKKSHQKLPFFNWFHTFCCFQFAFMLVATHELVQKEYLLEIEVFAMLLAVLCHHMDYRGSLSCFQLTTGNVLESLYSSPGQLSRHYAIGQTFRLLNDPSCSILENVSDDQYKKILLLIDKMILATDLADHLNRMYVYEDLIGRVFNFELEEDRELLYQLIIGCIEMNDYARPWKHLREVAPRIFNEFLRQNDEPYAEGVFNFPDLTYRPKMAECHNLFLTSSVLPSFEKLCKIIPSVSSFIPIVKLNLEAWVTIRNKIKKEKTDNIMDVLLTEFEIREEPTPVAPLPDEAEESDYSEGDDQ